MHRIRTSAVRIANGWKQEVTMIETKVNVLSDKQHLQDSCNEHQRSWLHCALSEGSIKAPSQ